MKTKKIIAAILMTALLLAGCGTAKTGKDAESNAVNEAPKNEATTISDTHIAEDSSFENKSTSGSSDSLQEGQTKVSSESESGTTVELSGTDNFHITKGGTYTLSGNLNGQVVINTTEEIVLRLAGVSIQSNSGPAVNIQFAKNAIIEIVEGTNNFLADVASDSDELAGGALYSSVDMEIRGTGNLSVKGAYKHAISSDANLTISNGSIEVSAVKDGIHADGNLVIENGKIDIINSNEGIESKSKLYINGGNITLNSEDDGLNAATLIEINGGSLYGVASGDGIDSNGDLVINGGTVIVYAANTDNGPVDVGDDGGQFIVNGGTIFLSGGSMGIQVSGNSKQASLWIGTSLKAGNTIAIRSSDREEVLNQFEVANGASLAFYSSNDLQINGTYEAVVEGKSIGSTLLSGYSGTIGNGRMGPMGPNQGKGPGKF